MKMNGNLAGALQNLIEAISNAEEIRASAALNRPPIFQMLYIALRVHTSNDCLRGILLDL